MTDYTLAPNPESGKNFIIFNDSPFFASTLTVSIVATAKSSSSVSLGVSTPLVLGVDYFPAFLFNRATAELGQAVYGGIAFVDIQLAGVLTVDFSALGSLYSASGTTISSIYNNDNIDPLQDYWEDVVSGLPEYPHAFLPYDAKQPKGIVQTAQAIDDIADAESAQVSDKSILDFNTHISNTDNPHTLTATQVALGDVPNWSTGTALSIIAGGNSFEFATPLAVRDSVTTVVPRATQEVIGVTQLNEGSAAGDASNSTDGLTAAGLIYLLENDLISTGANIANNQLQKVQFTPFPIVYPATWKSVVCNNFEALVQAVQAFTGISQLTASAAEGCIYFPHSATAPDLTLS